MEEKRKLIDENGVRTDGRTWDQLRPIKIEVGTLHNANGSAYIEFGKNKIVAAVYGPKEMHPKHMLLPDRAVLKCRYHMAPFSVDERKNPAPSRREIEISKVIREAIQPALILEDYPRTAIQIYVEVLQSDGGSRVVGITAASLALADAGINTPRPSWSAVRSARSTARSSWTLTTPRTKKAPETCPLRSCRTSIRSPFYSWMVSSRWRSSSRLSIWHNKARRRSMACRGKRFSRRYFAGSTAETTAEEVGE